MKWVFAHRFNLCINVIMHLVSFFVRTANMLTLYVHSTLNIFVVNVYNLEEYICIHFSTCVLLYLDFTFSWHFPRFNIENWLTWTFNVLWKIEFIKKKLNKQKWIDRDDVGAEFRWECHYYTSKVKCSYRAGNAFYFCSSRSFFITLTTKIVVQFFVILPLLPMYMPQGCGAFCMRNK